MNIDIKREIKEHALDESPKECCGLIVKNNNKLEVIRCKNISERPYETYCMNMSEVFKIQQQYEVIAYYHSHPLGDEKLNDVDKQNSEYADLPLYVYSCQTDKFDYYEPCGFNMPLEGRCFVLNLTDCKGLAVDYYKQYFNGGGKLNIQQYNLGDIINLRLIEKGLPHIRFGEHNQYQLVQVYDNINTETVQELKEHDLLCFCINNQNVVDHLGIYLGNLEMLHHAYDRPSRKTYLGSWWLKRVKSVWRPVDLSVNHT